MYVSWNNHVVNLTASVINEVACEKCRTKYFYVLQRTESGSGTSLYGLDEEGAQGRAANAAAVRLKSCLDNAFELVPCPNCGDYQANMVAFLKSAHLKWMNVPAGLLIVGSVIALIVALNEDNMIYASIAAVAFLVGAGLIIFRRWSVSGFNPNQGDPEPRLQVARELAFLQKDLPDSAENSEGQALQKNPAHRRRIRRSI